MQSVRPQTCEDNSCNFLDSRGYGCSADAVLARAPNEAKATQRWASMPLERLLKLDRALLNPP